MIPLLKEYLEPSGPEPNIFRAAQNNDTGELSAALDSGQSLSDQEPELMMSPLHIAAARHSNDFLGEALKHESCDPFLVDANDRSAWDHAFAYNNTAGCEMLRKAMSADLFAPDDRHIDYGDDSPVPA